MRGAAIEACSFLESQLPEEIDAVAEKRRRLAEGEFQPGDMSPPARCERSGAKLGLATALIVVTVRAWGGDPGSQERQVQVNAD